MAASILTTAAREHSLCCGETELGSPEAKELIRASSMFSFHNTKVHQSASRTDSRERIQQYHTT